ncbi:MAG TPA: Gfo/Idh/MocA family oxidoreductase [Spirochaetia bacterium]|nr:Gfo/Idh/MocA family oxidoreductase [Spirochaetia bacterium]
MKDIGIGVVGLGRLGAVHARNISKRIKKAGLIAVCDLDESLARSTAAELRCRYFTDMRRMIDERSIDAVCVATPTAHHVEPVSAVAEAGKPLFCEKPLSDNLKDTLHLVKLIKQAGIQCQVGFHRRFDRAYAEAEQMIEEGAIGKPVYFHAVSRDPFPPPPWACDPERGGGLFIDMLLHDFDLARFLMKDEVASVFADETNLVVDGEGINRFADNVTASLRFEKGALGTAHASMHARYGYDIRSEVFGSEGGLLIGGLNSTELTLCTPERGISRPRTFLPEGDSPHFMVRFKEAYISEISAFVDCILDGAPVKVNEDDALKAFQVSLAAARSAGERKPVSLLTEA